VGARKVHGLNEPVVPPFSISDYCTGCMGAISALTGLYHRATKGGSWHGKVSLLQYDLLLFKVGLFADDVLDELRKQAGQDFLALRHNHSVDQISSTTLRQLKKNEPELFNTPDLCEKRYSQAYKVEVSVVRPVVEVRGLDISFKRASRPNDSDYASWDFRDVEKRLS
jgi:crotonobetainyl-CoA:carnitine CoA-transferase CaiB-like acyl-CoA transferase